MQVCQVDRCISRSMISTAFLSTVRTEIDSTERLMLHLPHASLPNAAFPTHPSLSPMSCVAFHEGLSVTHMACAISMTRC